MTAVNQSIFLIIVSLTLVQLSFGSEPSCDNTAAETTKTTSIYDSTVFQQQCTNLAAWSVTDNFKQKQLYDLDHTNFACHRCRHWRPRPDALFDYVKKLQGDRPFGSLLDAGTGKSSLLWILQQTTTKWKAITAAERTRSWVLDLITASTSRPQDAVLVGDWAAPIGDARYPLPVDETFDTVLVDYVLGSLDGFAPFYQSELFPRFINHMHDDSVMYVVGQEPYRMVQTDTAFRNDSDLSAFDVPSSMIDGASIARAVFSLRDTCLWVAGKRFYREYTLEATIELMKQAGLDITAVRMFPIVWGVEGLLAQLDTCESNLWGRGKVRKSPANKFVSWFTSWFDQSAHLPYDNAALQLGSTLSRDVVEGIETATVNIRSQLKQLQANSDGPTARAGVCSGIDYVIMAKKRKRS